MKTRKAMKDVSHQLDTLIGQPGTVPDNGINSDIVIGAVTKQKVYPHFVFSSHHG
jgi:hypothetical protein